MSNRSQRSLQRRVLLSKSADKSTLRKSRHEFHSNYDRRACVNVNTVV